MAKIAFDFSWQRTLVQINEPQDIYMDDRYKGGQLKAHQIKYVIRMMSIIRPCIKSLTVYTTIQKNIMFNSHIMRNPAFSICNKKQRRRSATQ